MQIICDGMQRSGSSWCFNTVKALLACCRPGEEVYAGYEENIALFLASVPHRARHVVIKTHLLDPIGRAFVRSGQAKAIYTWRDLPDAMASFLAMFGGDFEHAFLALTASLVVFRFHRKENNALMVGYDEMMGQPEETVRRMADYIGLHPDQAMVREIVEEQSIPKVRERIQALENMPDEMFIQHQGSICDPVTALHRDHIRNGGSGYGAKTLTPEQLERLEALRQEYGLFDSLSQFKDKNT